MIIRSIAITDFSQWQVLWDRYNCFYGRNSFAAEITRLTWERFFNDQEPVNAIVAEKKEKLLGMAHYIFHRSTIQIKVTCYLQDLYVNEEARGQGVGRKLIQAVYEKAQLAGANRVYWQTQENNLIARKLYDKVAELTPFIVYRKNLE